MEIKTQLFGSIEIREEDVYSFPQGIPGFEEHRRFIILRPDQELPFSYLQSIDEGELSFLMTNPFLFYENYEFELSKQDQRELAIQSEQDVTVWVMVSVKQTLQDATLNLMAPVIMNPREKLGKQAVLQGTPYKTKHLLLSLKPQASNRGEG